MTRQVVRMVGGLALALGLALPFMLPSIGGIATWKVVLAAVGVFLFVVAGRGKPA